MNNKGFIATSLIYSFFLIFVTLFLGIIADYLQDKVLLNTIEKGIKEDLNSTMGIQDFEVGDKLYFNVDVSGIGKGLYYICSISYRVDTTDTNEKDKLYLSSSEDCSSTNGLDITGKRLIIEKNSNDYDNTINISGVE